MQEILKFWFIEYGYKDWFKQDGEFDKLIDKKFHELWLKKSKEKIDFTQSAKDLLAEIILFDQFSRNIFRGSVKAYSEEQNEH